MNIQTLPRTVAAFVLFSAEISAQTPSASAPSERVVYEAAFYAPFSPRTALDMVKQTPGFTLDTSDEDDDLRRGFSGAVGNVLIDGERLSAKSQTLSDVLTRVSAAEVLRIEILRGSEVAGDASNATVLANVVRTRTAGSGTWVAGFEITNQREPVPNGRFGWSGRSDDTEYSIGGNFFGHDHTAANQREVRDADDLVIQRREGAVPHESKEYRLNGQLASRVAGGKLTFTGQAFHSRFSEDLRLLTTDAAGALVENELTPFRDDTRTGEAGLSFQRGVAGWDLELNALATRKRYESNVSSTLFDAANVQQSVFVQDVWQDSGESIVRGTLARNLPVGRIETGAEVAINTLDGSMDLTLDSGSGATPLVVPNANLSVEEKRAEAFVSHVWPLNPRWSLDSRLAAETSRLSFTGDTDQSVSLSYVKPRLQLTRKLGAHQLQLRAFRDVGQLDFTDFVSTAALSDDVINGGNPDLRPQVAWVAEAAADLRFRGDAALRARVFHQWLDDVVDLIPVGTPVAFDAPGNIGEGTLLGAEVTLQLPLGRFLPGGTLTSTGTWQDAEVTDPLTGEQRTMSDFIARQIELELRQDLNAWKLAWGLSFSRKSPDSDFRFNEVDSFRQLHMLEGFIETSLIAGLKLRLDGYNLLGDTELRDRRFYSPDRNGLFAARELSEFHPGMWWQLTLSGSF